MPYTLTRDQRDALHAEAITELAEIGDVYLALENDDYRLAQELWRRNDPLLVLIDQIGWAPQPPEGCEVFEVSMPVRQLAFIACRLSRLSLGRLRDHAQRELYRDHDAADVVHCVTVAAVCTSLLADVTLATIEATEV